jgi:hypothetical protein
MFWLWMVILHDNWKKLTCILGFLIDRAVDDIMFSFEA